MKKWFLLLFLAWFIICLLGALPYFFSGFSQGFINAFFESVSGFTTTGATLLTDIEALPKWLLFWRAATQWLGGIGIVVFTVSLLPFLGAGGFQLRKTEASGADREKTVPRIGRTAHLLLLLYAALTTVQFLLLIACGMDWFDAITHSFSTVSTGGFSVRNNGLSYYHSPAIEWVCLVFMFLAGLNLFLIRQFLRGKPGNILRNSETRAYTGIILFAGIMITAAILRQSPLKVEGSSVTALRQALFHVISLISTSGFSVSDHNLWPPLAHGVLFFLLFIGGCSGSTAGGVKVVRYVVLAKQTWNEMRRIIFARGVFSIQLDGKSGKKGAVYGVAGFVFLYFLTLFFAALLVGSSGADVFTSLNTALVCQGNIGLGMGIFNLFPVFPSYVKWGLCLVMLMGRLELWAVLVLFTRDYWRK